jgi:hypothetical protein
VTSHFEKENFRALIEPDGLQDTDMRLNIKVLATLDTGQ